MVLFKRVIEGGPVVIQGRPDKTAENQKNYDRLCSLAESTNPFVLSEAFKELVCSDKYDSELPDLRSPLDMPFVTCFFEVASLGPLFNISLEGAKGSTTCFGLLIHEVHPDEYFLGWTSQWSEGKGPPIYFPYYETINLKEKPPGSVYVFIRRIMYHIKNSLIGSENIIERVRIGTGPSRRKIKLRPIVRLMVKSERQTAKPLFAKEIDWSHRWEVRGHWRKLVNGIGKDREGNYSVSDYTWVTDHVKGPEEKPMVKKARLLIAKQQQDQE